jgi:hypothetical protein
MALVGRPCGKRGPCSGEGGEGVAGEDDGSWSGELTEEGR